MSIENTNGTPLNDKRYSNRFKNMEVNFMWIQNSSNSGDVHVPLFSKAFEPANDPNVFLVAVRSD